MHTRRLAAFLLGAWILGSAFMTFVAINNLREVDRFLAEPPAKAGSILKTLGADNARLLLRHQASQLNRDYFNRWEQVEMLIGFSTVVCLVFATHRRLLPFVLGAMAVLVVMFLHFFIAAEISFLGSALDFQLPGAAEAQRSRLWALHQVYTAGTLVKLFLCVTLTAYLLWFRSRSTSRRHVVPEIDAIDDAHYTQAQKVTGR